MRDHDQTALHERVAQIGTIVEFLRWFDDMQAGRAPDLLQQPARHCSDDHYKIVTSQKKGRLTCQDAGTGSLVQEWS